MHFWIDKPAGRCSTSRFHGRYPMNFPKTHFAGQHHRCAIQDVGRLQSMFPPVHRFQNVNNDGNSAGPSNPRSLRTSAQDSSDNRNDAAQSSFQQDNANINSNNTNNNQRVSPRSTSDANRGLLNVLECNYADMRVYKCNVWIIFITAIAFLAVTRFYFDYQQSEGAQVFVIFGLLAILLMYRCIFWTLCPPLQNNHHEETQSEPIATVTVLNTISNESISDVSMPIRQNPPPPYHIAILIPPPTSPDEAPPPAYDKIIQ